MAFSHDDTLLKLKLFEQAVESSTDAIFTLGTDGTITSCNRGAEQMVGFSASEMISGSLFNLVPNDNADAFRDNMGRLAQGKPIDHCETVFCHQDGQR